MHRLSYSIFKFFFVFAHMVCMALVSDNYDMIFWTMSHNTHVSDSTRDIYLSHKSPSYSHSGRYMLLLLGFWGGGKV